MRLYCVAGLVSLLLGVTLAARDLPKAVVADIQSNQGAVERIIQLVQGEFRHEAYRKLANFTDTYGHRVSGSEILEVAISYVLEEMEAEGYENVHPENVTVPHWVRGQEYARLVQPRPQHMQILGLGSSVGTQGYPDGKLQGQVLVVRSFDELEERKAEAVGKIVVFNQDWTGYASTVAYRSGAAQASKVGAIASLTRSVADFSLYTPHTGMQNYGGESPIPTACITIEDADLLQRFQDAGENITIELMMEAENMPDTVSRNIVAEIVGTQEPEKVVVFGGHIDSWDVGSGVMDDGGGSMISWQVLAIMKKLGLRPKRTLRCVLWTSEEVGLIGGHQYYKDHVKDKDNMVLMMEADYGIFNPVGMKFDGSGLARAYMEEVMELLAPIDATSLTTGASTPDLSMWDAEVPKASIDIENDKYFWYHHTHADSITMLDPNDLDLCSVVWASTAYVLANLDEQLPRTGDYPDKQTSGAPVSCSVAPPLAILLLLLTLHVLALK